MNNNILIRKNLTDKYGNNVDFLIKTDSINYEIIQLAATDTPHISYEIKNTHCSGSFYISDSQLLYVNFDISAYPHRHGLGTLLLDCVFELIQELENIHKCKFHSLRGHLSDADKPYKWEKSIPFYENYPEKMSSQLKYSNKIKHLFIYKQIYNKYTICSRDTLYNIPSNHIKHILFLNNEFADNEICIQTEITNWQILI